MSPQTGSQNLPRVEFQVHIRTGRRGRRQLRKGVCPKKPTLPADDVPRLTRLLALAHRWNRLIENSVVANFAEIARIMGISRARVTQIMELLYLAPEIQEHILSLPSEGRSVMVPERVAREITGVPIWKEQCKMWKGTIGDDY